MNPRRAPSQNSLARQARRTTGAGGRRNNSSSNPDSQNSAWLDEQPMNPSPNLLQHTPLRTLLAIRVDVRHTAGWTTRSRHNPRSHDRERSHHQDSTQKPFSNHRSVSSTRPALGLPTFPAAKLNELRLGPSFRRINRFIRQPNDELNLVWSKYSCGGTVLE
jgi:hypothetical protein